MSPRPKPGPSAKPPAMPTNPSSRPATPAASQRLAQPLEGSPIPVYISPPKGESLSSSGLNSSPGQSLQNARPTIPGAPFPSAPPNITGRARKQWLYRQRRQKKQLAAAEEAIRDDLAAAHDLDDDDHPRQPSGSAFQDPVVYQVPITQHSAPAQQPDGYQQLVSRFQSSLSIGAPSDSHNPAPATSSSQPAPSQQNMPASQPTPTPAAQPAQAQELVRATPAGSVVSGYFITLLDNRINGFTNHELRALCEYLDPTKAEQRDLVFRLAKELPWESRPHRLTIILAHWILSSGEDDQLVADLLTQRLNAFDDELAMDTLIMSLDEVSELMDIQIILDDVRGGLLSDKTEEEKKEIRERILSRDCWASLMN
ncbi:hypothetical protein F5Y13DRAFT_192146 [Hypoxylon sp. FL1857]|nr:hypothetical protein F5Y13DRAFT_192146 [Hypoxylon sp. FL1857]